MEYRLAEEGEKLCPFIVEFTSGKFVIKNARVLRSFSLCTGRISASTVEAVLTFPVR